MAISSPSLRMWGRFEHSLDDKGRVIVPQKFRDKLGEEFVLTIGPDRHIRAYPMPIWDAMDEQLASVDVLDELNKDVIFLQRMFGNCEFVSPDTANRLSIPRHLREWANLRESEPAIIIGSGTRVEFWSRANWEAYSARFTEENAADAAERRKTGQNAANKEAAPNENGGGAEG
ncbi:MAG TPA: division/cell wall cluster transcriptional repressor MraZ [Chthonomonadaceae bacterium]|nr:division/cell wall cluster transcriptional repressor MraZ [Chthonomonadaceae bacterium]